MPTTTNELRAPSGHEGLLRSLDDLAQAELTVDSWFRSTAARGHKMCTLAAVSPPGSAGAMALLPADLHPSAAPVDLVHRARSEGFTGLGILIWADRVIAETSQEFHDGIEAALTDLCADHPVSVLCVYDRPGVGAACLDLAVGHHLGGLYEQQLTLRKSDEVVRLNGEIDMTNLDVVATALRAAAEGRPERLRIDLSGTTFLSAAAAQLVDQHVRALRADGAHVEVRGAAPHVARVLQMIARHVRPEG
jgi:anti-anti-sigma factor